MTQSLPGFREFYPAECAVKRAIFQKWQQTVLAYGFAEVEAPILEPLELFTDKSGPEIAEQLFNFVDKGGRAVALRPEFTPSVVRMVAARAQGLRKPIKWFNIGEQFRFERPQKGRLRAFYQLNVDCFGLADFSADAELIALLIQLFRVFGLTQTDVHIRLSDRNLWFFFLESCGITGQAAFDVLALIDKMEREDRAKSLEKIQKCIGDNASVLLTQIEALIAARDLASLKIALGGALSNPAVAQRLAEWEGLLGTLEAMGVHGFIQIDLGIVRGLAYYTGFVFEAFEVSGRSRALAGGGRYDTLVEKLGGPALPAVGFAIGDVVLTDLLTEKNLLPTCNMTPDFYVVSSGPAERRIALGDVQILRAAGFWVEYSLVDTGFSKQLKLADQAGARHALIYGESELAQGLVKLRHLGTRVESDVPRAQLKETLSMLSSVHA